MMKKKLSSQHWVNQRRGAPEAQLLYQETESVKQREAIALARKANALSMPHPDRRPEQKKSAAS